ncbi:hypothetical protein SDC9_182771 [bioreactor metagenome]|uniref:Uncharacterized protein n=1 Tax=bioreactor metagenome TaxID=1076179 RepID=A0A645HGM5_9ZZZZ|nr:hypothetical protein [Citrobacter sp. XY323]ECQ9991338.1 hypothetical protein [Salmonella enterica]EEI9343013.1 hypothetical protein [Salmonella enterica subsp. enterica serovar Hvittingfoss]HEC6701042.1 hypothetical protein [Salmonella enterica subsp. enterica serovar Weltevreden]EHI4845743.1 hypothetical protein [Salmonella enterica]MCS8554123.1 hypothetical protein [Citrobacter sp. XY323]
MKSKTKKDEVKLFLYVLMGMILSWALYVGYTISLNQNCLQQEGLSSKVLRVSESYLLDFTNIVTFGVLKDDRNVFDYQVRLLNKEFGVLKDNDKCTNN